MEDYKSMPSTTGIQKPDLRYRNQNVSGIL